MNAALWRLKQICSKRHGDLPPSQGYGAPREIAAPRSATLFVEDSLRFIPSSRESALLAGELFTAYLERGGREGRVIADFLIAAHAKLHADRLLARDRRYLRDYFSRLKLLVPASEKEKGRSPRRSPRRLENRRSLFL